MNNDPHHRTVQTLHGLMLAAELVAEPLPDWDGVKNAVGRAREIVSGELNRMELDARRLMGAAASSPPSPVASPETAALAATGGGFPDSEREA